MSLALKWNIRRLLNRVFGLYWVFTNALSKLKFFFHDIKLGDNCKFYGIPLLFKDKNASIKIGDRLVIRTSARSNSAGIRQKSFISAYNDSKIIIGDDCGFSGVVISAANEIVIGNRVMFGVNCIIIDNDRHDINYKHRSLGKDVILSAPIFINDDVWLGMNVTVLKGVNIGKGVVIGANSTVTSDIPDFTLAAGCPARVIKKINICDN